MSDASQRTERLWPWYRVYFDSHSGGDFCETEARNETHAARIIFERHKRPGYQTKSVEFASWHPRNRAMLGLQQ